MSTTTLGVKLDAGTRERLKQAAASIDRTPHWVVKQAIFSYLERLETQGLAPPAPEATDVREAEPASLVAPTAPQPFLDFAQSVLPQSVLRAAITAATRRPEPEVLPALLEQARLGADDAGAVRQLALRLAQGLRNQKAAAGRAGLVQGLLQEFALSSQEGVALMCLAEALLRIPDKATRDALIRDKIGQGEWHTHLGQSPSLFVNAATWGLMLTGKLVATHNEARLAGLLARVLGKGGEPLVRKGVDMAMRLMGEQFVTGETIAAALANSAPMEARGFRYSYDMLGEAALTDADAQRYLAAYQQAIHAIGKASHGRGIYEGPGISIKLSALHPRYGRAQYERVLGELYPRLLALTLLARQYDIGLNIDAEEAERLEISLDLLERLCHEPQLAGWNGIGFVIQAYQKRCPMVIDHLVDLARRSRRRLMIRLVKGAYWDSEIKRAQLDGLEGYPVYTRKAYTDVSYLACARKLLAVPEAVYPQFATHNAQTLAAVHQLAGQNYYPGQYEFQCLHGMGEPLYEQVVAPVAAGGLARPCRIYAPVGVHETLLAYLVRRLLENGANTSFVNRISDVDVALEELIRDPVEQAEEMARADGCIGAPHPKIALPRELYGRQRVNSAGIDLSNEQRLASLSSALLGSGHVPWRAAAAAAAADLGDWQPVCNPADRRDVVGQVREASAEQVQAALRSARAAALVWQGTPPAARAAALERAADLLEGEGQPLMGLLVREAGKSYANALGEVREAADFLRYYAAQVRATFDNGTHRPLGVVVCISPWNFPLSIFTGQVAAALAAGNTVLAKPAEQTPLVAAQAVRLLHAAGVPDEVLQLLPGRGETVGARLVADPGVNGVLFTGSTEVAAILQRTLAERVDATGRSIPLIAETGGQNAMIVDSSALPEQVVADVMSSAYDSAGQRCSALRVLCVQEDAAPRIVEMLQGALAEWQVGNPERLAVDAGPVIDGEARARIERHIEAMRERGRKILSGQRSDAAELAHGEFVPPTLIELESLDELDHEVFGPVLHLLRWRRSELGRLIEQVNATGYALTLGVHTRIDETIDQVVAAARAGNIYVNRNMVGAVVGVQPFGGHGLSGTGPKAGGPLYLFRLLARRPPRAVADALAAMGALQHSADDAQCLQRHEDLTALADWAGSAKPQLVALCREFESQSPGGSTWVLRGPTGEHDSYSIEPRAVVLCLADDPGDLLTQLAAVLAVGATALWPINETTVELRTRLPQRVAARVRLVADWQDAGVAFDAVLHHGDGDHLRAVCRQVASRGGAIVGVTGMPKGETAVPLERLVIERSLSINTAAAGGNASLMTME